MKKAQEQQIAGMVFGANAGWEVEPSESPDFLYRRSGSVVHGVEVTEYFDSESDARLQNIPEYASQLLKSRHYLHKDDKDHLEVRRVTYCPGGDTSKGVELDAIVTVNPPVSSRLGRLADITRGKSGKCALYLAKAPQVDLLVHDRARAFGFSDFSEIYRPLSVSPVRRMVIASGFREVFLLTRGNGSRIVCIPLKANVFVEEIMVVEHILRGRAGIVALKSGADFLKALVWMLMQAGFGSARVAVDDSGLRFRYASIDFVVGRNGRAINDYTTRPSENMDGHEVSKLAAEVSPGVREYADNAIGARAGNTAAMPIFFPADAVLGAGGDAK